MDGGELPAAQTGRENTMNQELYHYDDFSDCQRRLQSEGQMNTFTESRADCIPLGAIQVVQRLCYVQGIDKDSDS